MAVLERGQLFQRLADRSLVVTPLLHKKQVGEAAIDLRMGNVAKLIRSRGIPVVDPKHYRAFDEDSQMEMHKSRQQRLERHDIPFGQVFFLHPGTLALVPTIEWVCLPSNLQGMVTARSSWAREGLNIATATFINPGYSGIITLELANLGGVPMKLYPGLRVAQIAFYDVGCSVTPPASEYQEEGRHDSQFQGNYEPQAGNLWAPDVDPFITHDNLQREVHPWQMGD